VISSQPNQLKTLVTEVSVASGPNLAKGTKPMPAAATPSETSPAKHRTELRVPLFEVDLGQAVYHGNYFHLFELARESFLRDLDYPYRRFMEQQLHLTVVEVACAYRKGLHYDDRIFIDSKVTWWRSRSLGFAQSVHTAGPSGKLVLCTEATFNMVCVRFSGQPTTLPEEFVQRLIAWSDSKPSSKQS
jgi:acyl-CoA thioester hydrolase